jgi:RimJ/RimL family protein N-acetyltransferase
MTQPTIAFLRLTEVPLHDLRQVLDEPRSRRHMPLAAGHFSLDQTADWVRDKDAQWQRNGYGPWAVLIDHELAGWGGFQREEGGADFALVLSPRYWGHGSAVARRMLDRAFDELALHEVLVALPFTRNPATALARFGFEPAGDITYGAVVFRQFRLRKTRWQARQAPTGHSYDDLP